MRTYGNVKIENDLWVITCEPQVVMRMKRVFDKISKHAAKHVYLSDTLENARELFWFLDRYPMVIGNSDLAYLKMRAKKHREREDMVAKVLAEGYIPAEFTLSVPPREYQRVAAELYLRRGDLLLADDVGTGKTCSAICSLTSQKTLPALVVTLAHLPRQWEQEIKKFAPHLKTQIIRKGTVYDLTKYRGKTLPFPDVVITNYHKLGGWAETLAGRVNSIIFDECQELRRAGSIKYDAAKHISDATKFRIGLSATPILNYGGEIFNVVEVLSPGALGDRDEFHREWCSAGYGEKPRLAEPEAFGMYLREQGIMLRRTRKDVGRELPPLTIIPHQIDADMDAIEKVASSATELAKIILAQGGKGFDKMQASQELDYRLRQATGIAKALYAADFVRLLVESGESVVLYGWHREVYSLWLDRLKDLAPAMYTGTESNYEKEESKRRFLDGETQVLIMSLRSGAGLDGLQAKTRTVVIGELDWSPGVHEQGIGRVYRDGQADPVVAYYLLARHGSDPVIASVLGLKKAQIDGIRDPNADTIVATTHDSDNVVRLAEAFLQQRGIKHEPDDDNDDNDDDVDVEGER